MGTQAPGRKRIPNREKLTAEDDALNQIAREAEARLAAKRAARAEAREIRMKELERQQKEEDSERYSRPSRRHASMSDDEEKMSVGSRGSLRVEERPDRDFLDKGSRTASTLSAATLASLGGTLSRRGSCDTSFSVETEASIRDMRDSLAESEEKYRKAMVSNAQLHNEKSTVMYQVETLKEELSDMEELLWESRRHCEDRTKEFERERQAHSVLQFLFRDMEGTVRRSEELLTEVSELRVRSSSYCQEVSDLQEVLQWKEKKMAALERQIEIADIVQIERDRLRDDVVRLRDLLKKHGVVVSPELSTNGETGQDDDVSAESASRLAQEPSHGGRESMLGKVGEPAETSKLLQDAVNLLNATSTGEQTTPVKGFDTRAKDKAGGDKDARKLPRSKGSETSQIRQDGNSLLRNKGMKKQPGTCEPKTAVARFVDSEAFKGRTKPLNQDVLVTEMERSFDDQICKKKGTQVSVSWPSLTAAHEKQKQHVTGNQSSDRDCAQNPLSAVDPIFQNPEKDGNTCRDVSGSGGEVVAVSAALGGKEYKINEFCTPTSADNLKENEAEIGGDECDGQRSEDEDSSILTDLVENETFVPMGQTSQGLVHQRQVLGNLGSPRNKEKALKNEGDLRFSGVSEGPSETGPSDLDAFLTAEEATVGGTSGTPERPENWGVYEPVQSQGKTSSVEMWKDWILLENTIHSMLRGFVEENQGFAAEISRIFPEVPESLERWISEFQETLKIVAENVSDQRDSVEEPTGQVTGIKDSPERSKNPDDPESENLARINDCSVSGMLAGPPHTYHVSVDSRKVHEDAQDPPAMADQESPQNPLDLPSICTFNVESSPEETRDSVDAEEEKRSRRHPAATSWSEEFVFVELYFAEPVVEEIVETQLKKPRTFPTNSSFRRLIEITAEEIKAMALPELVFMSLREGIAEDLRVHETTHAEDRELSDRDTDSCEEVDEEAGRDGGCGSVGTPAEEISTFCSPTLKTSVDPRLMTY
ncbi:leucine-rich repeat flightless-interacting protein 1 isoform X4 [Cottoperca gobio]|uniref:Leucine-rich repeat flightless-interacting protein 1 isoform X4 n=1 Tax=Cottoperca gobio TaxID=56716 RepID=A0A6J2PBQ6_COTGO|nr:leucine-rich repeat flightless-interacting protein 1-like isoform X4 [Cottoperca gobio]